MSDPVRTPEQIENAVRDLKTNSIFADLPEADMKWLAEGMKEVRMNPGEVYGRRGDSLEYLNVMLEGEMHVERPDEPGTPMFIAQAPSVTGLLPFSRSKTYLADARVLRPARALLLHTDHFPEMLQRIPELAPRGVGVMADPIC